MKTFKLIKWITLDDKDWIASELHNRVRRALIENAKELYSRLFGLAKRLGLVFSVPKSTINPNYGDTPILTPGTSLVDALSALDSQTHDLEQMVYALCFKQSSKSGYVVDPGGTGKPPGHNLRLYLDTSRSKQIDLSMMKNDRSIVRMCVIGNYLYFHPYRNNALQSKGNDIKLVFHRMDSSGSIDYIELDDSTIDNRIGPNYRKLCRCGEEWRDATKEHAGGACYIMLPSFINTGEPELLVAKFYKSTVEENRRRGYVRIGLVAPFRNYTCRDLADVRFLWNAVNYDVKWTEKLFLDVSSRVIEGSSQSCQIVCGFGTKLFDSNGGYVNHAGYMPRLRLDSSGFSKQPDWTKFNQSDKPDVNFYDNAANCFNSESCFKPNTGRTDDGICGWLMGLDHATSYDDAAQIVPSWGIPIQWLNASESSALTFITAGDDLDKIRLSYKTSSGWNRIDLTSSTPYWKKWFFGTGFQPTVNRYVVVTFGKIQQGSAPGKIYYFPIEIADGSTQITESNLLYQNNPDNFFRLTDLAGNEILAHRASDIVYFQGEWWMYYSDGTKDYIAPLVFMEA